MELVYLVLVLVPVVAAAAAGTLLLGRRATALRTAAAYAGRHVLITGGTSGIGLAVATAAVGLGARVTVVGRDAGRLADAVALLRATPPEGPRAAAARGSGPPQVVGISADVSRPEGAATAVVGATAAHGPLDSVFCVAGSAIARRFIEMDAADLDAMVATNLGTALHTAHAAARSMAAVTPSPDHPRQLVLVSSMGGLVGVTGLAAYCAAKWGLRGLGEALYYELRPYGVGVSVVFPPDTATPGFDAENVGKPPETMAVSESGGLWQPADVAAKMLSSAAAGTPRITFGAEGAMLGGVAAGMGPGLGGEVLWGGVVRVVAQGYVAYWNWLIGRAHQERVAASTAALEMGRGRGEGGGGGKAA
ncbi:hypothetical protein MMPV_004858 [Pyropia vietnamensis]